MKVAVLVERTRHTSIVTTVILTYWIMRVQTYNGLAPQSVEISQIVHAASWQLAVRKFEPLSTPLKQETPL